MFPGGTSGVTIQIGGDSTGAQSAIAQTQSALGQLGQSAQQTGDTGFSSFQRFAVTLSSIINIAQQVAAAFDPVINAIQNMTDQMFELNAQTEKNVYAWQYLFGGTQNAASLAQWTSQFSMNVPFTRQDLIGAVSTLGTQYNMQQVEQYMPIIADLASTVGATAFGGQGVTLSQGAYALIDFMMGRSMPFKYEFHIKPEDLVKYGLDATVNSTGGVHINDLSTLMPALQRYDLAHGYAGAAQGTAQNTWWGEWSSFVDRLQNFGLMAGGTGLNGKIDPGSFFGRMKEGLTEISGWMDAHQDQIKAFADLIGHVLGQAVMDADNAFQGLFEGLQKSGLGGDITSTLKDLGNWLGNKDTMQGIHDIAVVLGEVGGAIAQIIGAGLGDLGNLLGGFFNGLSNNSGSGTLIDGLQQFAKILSNPEFQQHLHDTGDFIGSVLGGGFQTLSQFVGLVWQGLNNFNNALGNMFGFMDQNGKLNPFIKALEEIGKLVAMLAVGLGYMVVFLGDIAKIISDLNNPLALHDDLNQLQNDWKNFGASETSILQGYGLQIGAQGHPVKMAPVTPALEHEYETGITNALKKLLTQLEADAKKSGGKIAEFFVTEMTNAISSQVTQKAFNTIGQAIFTGLANGILGTIGGSIIAGVAHSIPHMATGGRILSAGVAIVGEHGPEMVHLPSGARVFPNGGSSSTRYGDSHVTNHLYNVPESTILRIVRGELASRGAMQSAMRRQPGSLSVAGSWGGGRGSY